MSSARRGKGNILAIDEVPAVYANESRELATLFGSAFKKGVKELPLFPLLGIDMPGVFLKIECTPDQMNDVIDKVGDSLQKYFRKGMKDER
jgi:hypothetical protein